MKGWISLHRRIRDHWIWQEKPFDKRSAWIDLLMMANHQENKILIGTKLVDVARGSFVTSEVKLSERWGWSRKKVRMFLEVLEKDKMLVKKSTTKYTSITIENYEEYQNQGTTKEQEKNSTGTSKEHQKNTNNNDNNENNENNDNKNNIIVLNPEEAQFIKILEEVKNYPLDRQKDLDMYNRLQERYPTLNLIESLKDWTAYKLDQPLKTKDNPRSQINTSFKKYVEWGKNLKGGTQVGGNEPANGKGPEAPKYDKSKWMYKGNGDQV